MYQVNSFTDALFQGNPAAVLGLDEALTAQMQGETVRLTGTAVTIMRAQIAVR